MSLSAIVIVGACALASGAMAQTVQLTLCVSDAEGDPVATTPLIVLDGERPFALRTDETGCTSLPLDTSPDDRTVAVHPAWTLRESDDSVDEIRADRQAARAVLDQYAFRYVYRVEIPSTATQVDVAIDALPSIAVTGSVAPVGWDPSVYKAAVLGYRGETRCDEAGDFRLTGVPRGEPVGIIIYNIFGGPVEVIHLSAAQTAGDIDIGAIAPAALDEDGSLEITLSQNDDVLEPFEKRGSSVTLIAKDGSQMLTYWLDEAAQPTIGDPGVTPSVPAGEYFVVPGWVSQNSFATDVWRHVQEGTVDLVAAGVPVITVTDGQPVTATIDAAAAAEAIRSAGGG